MVFFTGKIRVYPTRGLRTRTRLNP